MGAPQSRRAARPAGGDRSRERQRHERRGRLAEHAAALWLNAKGYRILARRYRTGAGEIDLIAVRRRLLVFVEVKQRPNEREADIAIGEAQRMRIRSAADLWLQKRPRLQDHEIRFDVVLILPWRLPRHLAGAL